jgi:CheY-like chemotaxis protein
MKSERFRVLLVEDNPGDARLLRETIRETNDLSVDLIHEDTLQRGLDRIGSDRFDVIMLDLSLPDEDGGAHARGSSEDPDHRTHRTR